MKYRILYVLLVFFQILVAQKKSYQISTIAFYNLENLFDSLDDPNIFDEEYTPNGKKYWTKEKVALKLKRMAEVISEVGKNKTQQPPTILGVAEIENKDVLQRLINQSYLNNIDYGIAHFDSPDKRGIDVALLYNRSLFKISDSQKHTLYLKDQSDNRIYTRDQLCVSGYLGGELIYFIVNHWPSRRGGTKTSEPKRIEAAKLNLKIIDSISTITKKPNIVIMGDFNDNPTNDSFKKVLKTKSSKHLESNFYNPMESMYKKGLGTLAYKDKWNLFDQLIYSSSLLDSIGFQLYQTKIFNEKKLIETKGKYAGYPKRCSGSFEGYSDHFPVYSYLVKRIQSN